MTQLAELDEAIRELNELWQLCTDDDQCDQLLDLRDMLDAQAQELADTTIQQGTAELNEAISTLHDLTVAARSAKKEVDDIAEKISRTAEAIDKASQAITKVAILIA